jgi:hypothetical protein
MTRTGVVSKLAARAARRRKVADRARHGSRSAANPRHATHAASVSHRTTNAAPPMKAAATANRRSPNVAGPRKNTHLARAAATPTPAAPTTPIALRRRRTRSAVRLAAASRLRRLFRQNRPEAIDGARVRLAPSKQRTSSEEFSVAQPTSRVARGKMAYAHRSGLRRS